MPFFTRLISISCCKQPEWWQKPIRDVVQSQTVYRFSQFMFTKSFIFNTISSHLHSDSAENDPWWPFVRVSLRVVFFCAVCALVWYYLSICVQTCWSFVLTTQLLGSVPSAAIEWGSRQSLYCYAWVGCTLDRCVLPMQARLKHDVERGGAKIRLGVPTSSLAHISWKVVAAIHSIYYKGDATVYYGLQFFAISTWSFRKANPGCVQAHKDPTGWFEKRAWACCSSTSVRSFHLIF